MSITQHCCDVLTCNVQISDIDTFIGKLHYTTYFDVLTYWLHSDVFNDYFNYALVIILFRKHSYLWDKLTTIFYATRRKRAGVSHNSIYRKHSEDIIRDEENKIRKQLLNTG